MAFTRSFRDNLIAGKAVILSGAANQTARERVITELTAYPELARDCRLQVDKQLYDTYFAATGGAQP